MKCISIMLILVLTIQNAYALTMEEQKIATALRNEISKVASNLPQKTDDITTFASISTVGLTIYRKYVIDITPQQIQSTDLSTLKAVMKEYAANTMCAGPVRDMLDLGVSSVDTYRTWEGKLITQYRITKENCK